MASCAKPAPPICAGASCPHRAPASALIRSPRERRAGGRSWRRAFCANSKPNGFWAGPKMDSQHAMLHAAMQTGLLPSRRYLVLFLPSWPTDCLKRLDRQLKGPLVLYERIKGGLRLAAVDAEARQAGLSVGQNL